MYIRTHAAPAALEPCREAAFVTIQRELLAACWTWAGDVGPGDEDPRSPIPLARRIAALAAARWTGAGFDYTELLSLREQYGLPTVRRMLSDAGIDRIELEFVRGWWGTGEVLAAADRKLDTLLDAAAELGAPALKIGAFAPTAYEPVAPERGRYEESLYRAADRADRFGVTLALEAMAGTNLPTFMDAVAFVHAVGHPRAGLTVDNYQLEKTGDGDFTRLPGLLAGAPIAVVELGDATVDRAPGAPALGIGPRCIPGHGDLDITSFVVAMHDADWEGHWGVEIIADDLRALPVETGLETVAKGIHAALDAADAVIAERGVNAPG